MLELAQTADWHLNLHMFNENVVARCIGSSKRRWDLSQLCQHPQHNMITCLKTIDGRLDLATCCSRDM